MNCFVLKALKLQIIANCCHAKSIIVSNCCNFRVIVEITENCLFVIRQQLGKPLSNVYQPIKIAIMSIIMDIELDSFYAQTLHYPIFI